MLFDLEKDPYEVNNLAGKPGLKTVREKMEARLQRWIKETGDPFDTGERDPKTGMLQLGQEFADDLWKNKT